MFLGCYKRHWLQRPVPTHAPCPVPHRSGGSLLAEFDLVCGRRWLLYLQTSAFFMAVLAGCALWQAGSERYGERSARLAPLCPPPCPGSTARTLPHARLLPIRPIPAALPPCAGRRRLLVAGAAVCGLTAMLAATAPSVWMYLLFRCLSGLGVGGMGAAAYALAADLAGPSWRAFVGLLLNAFFSGGLEGQGRRRLCMHHRRRPSWHLG